MNSRIGPDQGAGADSSGSGDRTHRESTALGPVQQRCAAGLGLSVEADLLAQAAEAGRPLDAAMLDRITFGECAPVRPLGEVPR